METLVFIIAAAIILTGAIGVVASRSPVHSALSLVMTLFGVAVIFVAQHAHFLAAVQIIVYAGAIVVLFLFVIMLLGVEAADDLDTEPLAGQRPLAAIAGVGLIGMAIVAAIITHRDSDVVVTGTPSAVGSLSKSGADNVRVLGQSLFTDYLYAFEITSVLLVIAVVAAVVLARKPDHIEPVDRTSAEEAVQGEEVTS
jgi:NADH-quinone oxidoreductase subunit J